MVGSDVNPPWMEGGGKSIFNLSKMLVEKGNDVHVVTTQPFTAKKRTLKKTEEIDGIIFHRVKVPLQISPSSKYTPTNLTAQISLTLGLLSILKRYDFDILHGYSGASIVAIRTILGKKAFKIPSVHTFYAQGYVPIIGSSIFLRYLALLDKIIVTTNQLHYQLSNKVDVEKLVNIPFGIDTDEFNLDAKSNVREEFGIGKNPLVLYVGHLYKEKGVKYLVKASPQVLEKFPEAKFLIAWGGIGDQINEIKRLIYTMKLNDSFIITGKRDDLAGVFAASDVFVLPLVSGKHTLGHPLTILESLACGTPVVSTHIQGVREIVKDGENGFLVHPRDYAGLADKICKMVEDKRLRIELGRNGSEMVKNNFSWKNISEMIMQVYDSVIIRSEK
jgi:glycosyltransferase involved in cell wall biosynthesis